MWKVKGPKIGRVRIRREGMTEPGELRPGLVCQSIGFRAIQFSRPLGPEKVSSPRKAFSGKQNGSALGVPGSCFSVGLMI
jgi:hypothetical protein